RVHVAGRRCAEGVRRGELAAWHAGDRRVTGRGADRRRVDIALLLKDADPVAALALRLAQGGVRGAEERVLAAHVARGVERDADGEGELARAERPWGGGFWGARGASVGPSPLRRRREIGVGR